MNTVAPTVRDADLSCGLRSVETPASAPPASPVQRWMLRSIDAYQRAFHGRPSPCRFFPSCSEYGAEAIRRHGAWRGLWLTVRRLVRCRPFGPSGFDPVPSPPHHPEH